MFAKLSEWLAGRASVTYIYSSKDAPDPDVWPHVEAAFAKADEAFREMDKAFEALRK